MEQILCFGRVRNGIAGSLLSWKVFITEENGLQESENRSLFLERKG